MWAFIVLGILLTIVIVFANTPEGKGYLGELYIKLIIGKTKENNKYVINDYMIEDENHSSQIDHIVVNKNGVFVIETKNYSGRIYGKDEQREWTQVLNYGKVKNHFYNPVKQNATHLYRVKKILPKNTPIYSIVVFAKNNTKYIESSNIVNTYQLKKVLNAKRDNEITPNQMNALYNTIIENKSDLSLKAHVQEIRKMQADIEANICPRCGAKLVERTGKYGKFLGCENYPKCKFVKKLK